MRVLVLHQDTAASLAYHRRLIRPLTAAVARLRHGYRHRGHLVLHGGEGSLQDAGTAALQDLQKKTLGAVRCLQMLGLRSVEAGDHGAQQPLLVVVHAASLAVSSQTRAQQAVPPPEAVPQQALSQLVLKFEKRTHHERVLLAEERECVCVVLHSAQRFVQLPLAELELAGAQGLEHRQHVPVAHHLRARRIKHSESKPRHSRLVQGAKIPQIETKHVEGAVKSVGREEREEGQDEGFLVRGELQLRPEGSQQH
mmetsp:Transcript_16863/g.31661  ORF Transcript_16863/g.31661 Transcript_16863/m.31661 type:complete len:254 (+) Transcript_16863:1126-1887(+)